MCLCLLELGRIVSRYVVTQQKTIKCVAVIQPLRVAFRYGVEPPVLVKLEKEIELEESLMLTEEPPPVVKTFSVCCQHGGLYQSGVGSDPSGAAALPFLSAGDVKAADAPCCRVQLISSHRTCMCDPVEGRPRFLPHDLRFPPERLTHQQRAREAAAA